MDKSPEMMKLLLSPPPNGEQGWKARLLARELDLTKKEVNRILYRELAPQGLAEPAAPGNPPLWRATPAARAGRHGYTKVNGTRFADEDQTELIVFSSIKIPLHEGVKVHKKLDFYDQVYKVTVAVEEEESIPIIIVSDDPFWKSYLRTLNDKSSVEIYLAQTEDEYLDLLEEI